MGLLSVSLRNLPPGGKKGSELQEETQEGVGLFVLKLQISYKRTFFMINSCILEEALTSYTVHEDLN